MCFHAAKAARLSMVCNNQGKQLIICVDALNEMVESLGL